MIVWILFVLGALTIAACVAIALISTATAIFGMMLVGGIVSASLLFGILKRSTTVAFQAFFLQLAVALGGLGGLGATILSRTMGNGNWESPWRWLLGPAVGALFGLAAASLFNWAWGRAARFVLKKLKIEMPETSCPPA